MVCLLVCLVWPSAKPRCELGLVHYFLFSFIICPLYLPPLYLGVKVTRWRSRIQSQYLISPVGYICEHYFINKCGDTGSNFRPGHAAITPYRHGDVFLSSRRAPVLPTQSARSTVRFICNVHSEKTYFSPVINDAFVHILRLQTKLPTSAGHIQKSSYLRA